MSKEAQKCETYTSINKKNFQKYFVAHEQWAVKDSFSTYICSKWFYSCGVYCIYLQSKQFLLWRLIQNFPCKSQLFVFRFHENQDGFPVWKLKRPCPGLLQVRNLSFRFWRRKILAFSFHSHLLLVWCDHKFLSNRKYNL